MEHDKWIKPTRILQKRLGLTSYESQAYVALVVFGPMSPKEVSEKASIPLSRSYGVLRNLAEKGLLIEQSAKPSVYAAIEPLQALKALLTNIELEMSSQLDDKKRAAHELTKILSPIYIKSKDSKSKTRKVWFTRRDFAFLSIYCEAIKNCEKEVLVATNSLYPPERKILEAVIHALKEGVSCRVVRQITDFWTLKDLKRYENVIKAGSQVRYLDGNKIPLRFAVFDEQDVIIVFPDEQKSRIHEIESLWVRIPPLAKILRQFFEELWNKGEPILPILEKTKRKKRTHKKTAAKKSFSRVV